jgi:hypothetical protein
VGTDVLEGGRLETDEKVTQACALEQQKCFFPL